MRGLIKFLGAGVMLAALSVTSAFAQSADQQVRTYLDASAPDHASRGYTPAPGTADLVVPLRLEGGYLWPVNLRQGVNYRVFGVCDNDCTDVDMEVYGADGQLVDRDIGMDDTPYVQITPTRSGRHYVRIWLASCNNEPCYVAARVVQGGAPEARQAEPVAQTPAQPSGGVGGYEQVVRSELDAAGAAHLQAGYARFGDDVVTPLRLQTDGHREVLRLIAGRPYLFQGACDQDCHDVDMEILDPRGNAVASDLALDDHPVVSVTPARTGDYTVRIWLANCEVEPCYVGMRSYGRGR